MHCTSSYYVYNLPYYKLLLIFLSLNPGNKVYSFLHNTTKCNAYTIDIQPAMLCYGDKIYISEFDSELTFNDDGDAEQKGVSQIREINKDGSGARVLYSADEGAVIGMEMPLMPNILSLPDIFSFFVRQYIPTLKSNRHIKQCK